jgi:hypothetical protein
MTRHTQQWASMGATSMVDESFDVGIVDERSWDLPDLADKLLPCTKM